VADIIFDAAGLTCEVASLNTEVPDLRPGSNCHVVHISRNDTQHADSRHAQVPMNIATSHDNEVLQCYTWYTCFSVGWRHSWTLFCTHYSALPTGWKDSMKNWSTHSCTTCLMARWQTSWLSLLNPLCPQHSAGYFLTVGDFSFLVLWRNCDCVLWTTVTAILCTACYLQRWWGHGIEAMDCSL